MSTKHKMDKNFFKIYFTEVESSLMLLISAAQQSDSVLHTTIFYILFQYALPQVIEYNCPVLYRRSLLFICSIYNSLHLLIPNSPSIPPSSPSPWQLQFCFLFVISSSVSYFRFHTKMISYCIYILLSGLLY